MAQVRARPSSRSRARRVDAVPEQHVRPRSSSHAKAAKWSPGVHRPVLLFAAIALCSGLLFARLVFWQVMQHGHLAAMTRAEHAAPYIQAPMRGRIFDSHGSPLATDVMMNIVIAAPKEIKQPEREAQLLAPVLHQPVTALAQKLSGAGDPSREVLLAARADVATSAKIQQLGQPGIILNPEIRRAYPDGPLAAQDLGWVTNANQGYYGLEGYYDSLLSGRASLAAVLKETSGHEVRAGEMPGPPSRDGADLHLSLDGPVQGIVEDLLQKAVKQHSADGGTIIVMNPNTGYIIAMASTPSFNPNRYWKSKVTQYANPATGYVYEPGSTFKIITMAAGLNAHVITPKTSFDDTGAWVVGTTVLHNWSDTGFGIETMTQVLQHSANVGASFVAHRLGQRRFYHYVKAFGLGKPTGIDVQGEEAGLLPLPGSKSWTLVNLYANSFGQAIATTPIQLLRAVCAVANGGRLMKPQLVRQIVYKGHVIDTRPVVQGRPISPRAARTLTNMLVHSAIGGEAEEGLVRGYNIAAKTGTANIAGPNGAYIQGATIASITGYAPTSHPRFAALVIIKHPRDTPWGSMAAAPVLHDLFQDLFMYYHIPPSPHALYR